MNKLHRPIDRRSSVAEHLAFFGLWLRRPLRVGAVVPSGGALARAMAACVDVKAPGAVIELGGGTGSVTRRLLEAGVPARELFVIEREPALARMVAANHPQVHVLEADARMLPQVLREAGVAKVKAVVSSLPLLSMDGHDQRLILGGSFEVMDPGGPFVQFTYGPASPISAEVRADVGIDGKRVRWVLPNVPPAAVWVYRRIESARPAMATDGGRFGNESAAE